MRKFYTALFGLIFVALPLSAEAMSSSVILNLVNAERRNAGLAELRTESKLTQAGQMKASDMATRGYFDHVTPDGKDPWDFLERVGYKWDWTGENLGMSTDLNDESLIVKAWMNSPGHRAIIMDGRYSETGIGISEGMYQGQKTVFVSQFFGSPTQSTPEPVPTPVPVVEPVKPVQPEPIVQPVQPVQNVQPVQPAQPIQTQPAPVPRVIKTTSQSVVRKVVEKVTPKAEAHEVVAATTTSTVYSVSVAAASQIQTADLIELSWLARLKIFLTRILSFSHSRLG